MAERKTPILIPSPMISPFSRLRLFSILDGISYLILLGVAMPLKYVWNLPIAVRIVGSLHGFLFIGLMVCLAVVFFRKWLPFGRCVLVFVCALIPVAPFFLDRVLKRWAGELRDE